MDCRHSTGDDQRLRTVQEMTRDCRQHRDDQRLRTVQEMTADLWGGGERVPEFDRYPLLLPRSCSLILPVPLSSRALSSRLL
ncbi:unnamed protein product [Staurois parvus]|uniref:Uncharacterized protein n=1 Tax=Staurois parvus TaxID=386267 RepID=A0ABN9FN01_9NEOB|nr:unnamed protein product [Staurois parvus]